ncbi:MAG: hypothetical protein JJU22_10850, partial [Gammaproteobacteria bacterium]|nr:hypothetical protein [Gammaproteobacteria bacterium]
AERPSDRRISLCEIALSHGARPPCGKALIAQRLGRSEAALPRLLPLPSLHVIETTDSIANDIHSHL